MDKKNQYKSIARHFKGQALKNKHIAAAYTEDIEDVRFWKKIFENYPISFHYFTRTGKQNKSTGSGQCLLFHQYNLLNKHFFICIDSDFRYIKQAKNIDIQHFVFQTYTHSIENHLCFEENLMQFIKHKNIDIFDFKDFLQRYSQDIFELFLYFIHSLLLGDNLLSIWEFSTTIALNLPAKINNTDSISELITEKYQEMLQVKHNKLTELKEKYADFSAKIMVEKLAMLDIYPHNCYLFIRGHNLYDNVVKPILGKLKNQSIANQDDNKLKNKIREEDWHKDLFLLVGKTNYVVMQKIQNDIKQFFH